MLKIIKKNFIYFLLFFIFFIYQNTYLNFFPNENGLLGHDFEYFMPNFIFGKIWFEKNFLNIPWFSPSFCCGIPFYPDPQTMFFSIQQIFYIIFEPVLATQVLFLYYSLISYLGMFFLLRKNFEFDSYSSLVGSTIFLFNGFITYRLIVGHIGYAGLAFVPLYCFFLLSSLKNEKKNLSIVHLVLSSLTLASIIYSGASYTIVMIVISIISILLIFNLKFEKFFITFRNFLISSSLAFLISISKISASFYFLKNFSRKLEPVYFENSISYILHTIKSFFLFSDEKFFNNSILFDDSDGAIGVHEIEVGVSIIPLFCILIFLFNFKNYLNFKFNKSILASLILILTIPFILNANLFSINKFWNNFPLIGNSWLHIRWNIIYIIPIILFSVSIINSIKISHKIKYLNVFLIFIIIIQSKLYNFQIEEYYSNQNFNPHNMRVLYYKIENNDDKELEIKSFAAVTDKNNEIIFKSMIINEENKSIMIQRNDYFNLDLSSFACYQPIYGYELETRPQKDLFFSRTLQIANTQFLQIGDPLYLDNDGNYNFINPSCLLFPENNDCKINKNFKKNNKENLISLLNYKQMKFNKNTFQTISDYISFMSFMLSVIFLLYNLIFFKKNLKI